MLGGAPADADGLVLHLDFNAESGGRVTDRVSGAAIPVLRDLDAIDGAIAGRLDGPGDTRSYSFTIDAPTLLAFDALHNDDRMTRSEEHTSELQSLMRISYAVFCLKKKKKRQSTTPKLDTSYSITK